MQACITLKFEIDTRTVWFGYPTVLSVWQSRPFQQQKTRSLSIHSLEFLSTNTSLEGNCPRVWTRFARFFCRRWRKTSTLNLTKSESLPGWSREPLVQEKHGRGSRKTLKEDGEIMNRHHSEWIKHRRVWFIHVCSENVLFSWCRYMSIQVDSV